MSWKGEGEGVEERRAKGPGHALIQFRSSREEMT